MEQLTPDQVAERFREAYRQSYTITDLPSGELTRPPLSIEPAQTPLKGVQFVTKRQQRKAQAALVRIGPEGISAQYSDGWINMTLDQIELVFTDDDGIRAFGRDSR